MRKIESFVYMFAANVRPFFSICNYSAVFLTFYLISRVKIPGLGSSSPVRALIWSSDAEK